MDRRCAHWENGYLLFAKHSHDDENDDGAKEPAAEQQVNQRAAES